MVVCALSRAEFAMVALKVEADMLWLNDLCINNVPAGTFMSSFFKVGESVFFIGQKRVWCCLVTMIKVSRGIHSSFIPIRFVLGADEPELPHNPHKSAVALRTPPCHIDPH